MKDMFFYDIGYYTHEESWFFQVMHEKKFSKTQLEKMVLSCIPILVENLLDSQLSSRDGDTGKDWKEDPYFIGSNLSLRFPDLMSGCYISPRKRTPSLSDVLCERFGFSPVKFQATYSRFGWGNILASDWEGHDGDEKAKARLTKVVRATFEDYLEKHPEVKDGFDIGDVKEFFEKLHREATGE